MVAEAQSKVMTAAHNLGCEYAPFSANQQTMKTAHTSNDDSWECPERFVTNLDSQTYIRMNTARPSVFRKVVLECIDNNACHTIKHLQSI